MKRLPKDFVIAAVVRWASVLAVLGLMVGTGVFARLGRDVVPLLLFIYIALYAVLWTRLLPQLGRRLGDGSVVILYDLALSSLPLLLDGGLASPFLPFALSTLVLPTLRRGWRGGLVVAVVFLAIDQIILWFAGLWTGMTPWAIAYGGEPVQLLGRDLATTGSLQLLGRTLLPFSVLIIVAGMREIARYYSVRARFRSPSAAPALYWEKAPRSVLEDPDDEGGSYRRSSGGEPSFARSWGKERASQPTLERRSPASIQAALRQHRPELASAGIQLSASVQGDERRLPSPVLALCGKAIEIAFDNVMSHAQARSVVLHMQIDAESARLRIEDDGIGLFDGTPEPPGFHQLKRLRYRAVELGGELRVEEGTDRGVVLELRLPLNP